MYIASTNRIMFYKWTDSDLLAETNTDSNRRHVIQILGKIC